MIKRYIQFLGLDQTKLLLQANERPLTPSIRVNSLKINTENLRYRLKSKGFELEPIDWISYGFRVKKSPFNLGATHELLQGYYYVQNVASMLPALILDPQSDETVIDMCAAPGGKASHLAQLMNNKGSIILIDRNINRIPALEINLRRLGVTNSIILNLDSTNLPQLNLKADKILLDAPCTGEGLIRQDPSRKTSKEERDIKKMAMIQKKLLNAGLRTLKPGGILLYSTCSIAPEENEFVVNDVLQNLSKYSIVEINNQYGSSSHTSIFGHSLRNDIELSQRLYPHIHNTIGFYLCMIKKKS